LPGISFFISLFFWDLSLCWLNWNILRKRLDEVGGLCFTSLDLTPLSSLAPTQHFAALSCGNSWLRLHLDYGLSQIESYKRQVHDLCGPTSCSSIKRKCLMMPIRAKKKRKRVKGVKIWVERWAKQIFKFSAHS